MSRMNRNEAIESLKNVSGKMFQHMIDEGHVSEVNAHWVGADLREFSRFLEKEDWSSFGEDVLSKAGGLNQKFSGRGEVFRGFFANGVIDKRDLDSFSDAMDFVSSTIQENLNLPNTRLWNRYNGGFYTPFADILSDQGQVNDHKEIPLFLSILKKNSWKNLGRNALALLEGIGVRYLKNREFSILFGSKRNFQSLSAGFTETFDFLHKTIKGNIQRNEKLDDSCLEGLVDIQDYHPVVRPEVKNDMKKHHGRLMSAFRRRGNSIDQFRFDVDGVVYSGRELADYFDSLQ